jgi:hypothetical protein
MASSLPVMIGNEDDPQDCIPKITAGEHMHVCDSILAAPEVREPGERAHMEASPGWLRSRNE